MNKLCTLFLPAILSLASLGSYADSTLVYELTDASGKATQQTYTIDGRWIRVDSDDAFKNGYLVLDTGFLIMHVVDTKNKTFTTFGRSPIHQRFGLPKKHKEGALHFQDFKNNKNNNLEKTKFVPGKKQKRVAGVRCREVKEITEKNKVRAEHCMADASAFGMTPRELITLSRLIQFSREMTDANWVAAQSKERYIPAESHSPDNKASFVLKSVSHERLPNDNFRIPKSFRIIEPKDDYSGLITGEKKSS